MLKRNTPPRCSQIGLSKFSTIIVLAWGGDYSKGAEQWIKEQTSKNQNLLHVFNLGESSRLMVADITISRTNHLVDHPCATNRFAKSSNNSGWDGGSLNTTKLLKVRTKPLPKR
ncbi:MAG: hypothetical protein M2R46_04042 [Verrucomicrobia subdivision 3 bacterium]|nr:hypothetical protein [Limisphaerales bacterium]